MSPPRDALPGRARLGMTLEPLLRVAGADEGDGRAAAGCTDLVGVGFRGVA